MSELRLCVRYLYVDTDNHKACLAHTPPTQHDARFVETRLAAVYRIGPDAIHFLAKDGTWQPVPPATRSDFDEPFHVPAET